jgi:hypothetical protein
VQKKEGMRKKFFFANGEFMALGRGPVKMWPIFLILRKYNFGKFGEWAMLFGRMGV